MPIDFQSVIHGQTSTYVSAMTGLSAVFVGK
jgi:hypothetical protein